MKLPLIRAVTEYIDQNDKESVEKAVALLEHIGQARGLKEDELNVIGELISNMCGGLEVHQMIQSGTPKSQALNEFMQKVLGSIDQ